ncbi:Permease of the drug/metabolite transporter (DMT) superfamily [Fervidobacterium changbaicum]|uniref:DMT family transporter n=1 Tax=Fervidobacterium islandicum TaxID=2423 RepID=A0AAI8CNI8_FERIS|nr:MULTISPECIES: DMT family transporter [Fervidobacterium]AMW33746.2 DMT family transporter [Fervidobacterium islandicum]SDH00719.1 Permease of the drug/metabolite transporter (DMT) superfamily [Fervidobacterium changbaicum]
MSLLQYVPVVLVTIFWGASFVATKFVVNVFEPFPAALYRFLIALVVLLPFTKKRKIGDINAFWSGFWGITMYFVFENTALRYTSPTNAAVIVSSVPLLYVLFTHLIHKVETTKYHYVGSVLAFLGVALVILNGRLMKLNPIGDILAFGAAVSWVFYTHYVVRIKDVSGIDQTFSITFWGVVTLIPFAFFQDMKVTFEVKSALSLIYLGVVCSALGYLLWNKSIEIIGDRRTTNFIYFIPIVTVISEFVLMKSEPTIYNILGVTMLVLGLYIFERGEEYGKKRLRN